MTTYRAKLKLAGLTSARVAPGGENVRKRVERIRIYAGRLSGTMTDVLPNGVKVAKVCDVEGPFHRRPGTPKTI
jgi:hypothetical protein